MNRETYDEFVKARHNGQLKNAADIMTYAPRFAENEFFTDPTSREGEQFQAYMESLTQKLLRKEQWKPKAPIYYYLSNDDEENAYVIPDKNVNILVLTKGLLKFLRNQDELSFILGHELGHIKVHDTLGPAYVTKGEEAAADVMQIPWMHQAGFNPLAGANVMTRFWRKHNQQVDTKQIHYDLSALVALKDEHPTASLRPALISNAVQGYARQKGITAGFDPKEPGNEEYAFKNKDKQLSEILKRAKPFDYFGKITQEANYTKLSAEQQLAFIKDHIADVQSGFAIKTRPQGLLNLIESCECDGRNPEHRKLGHEIINTLLGSPETFNLCYGTLAINTQDAEETTPVGPLIPIAESMRRIVHASSKKEIKEASQELMKFLDANPKLELSSLKWPAFELPSDSEILKPKNIAGIPLPWSQHVRWANELAQEEGDPTAQRALFRIGVQDKRLFDRMSAETIGEISRTYPIRKDVDAEYAPSVMSPLIIAGDKRISTMDIDNDGFIINVARSDGYFVPQNAKIGWSPAAYVVQCERKVFTEDSVINFQAPQVDIQPFEHWDTVKLIQDFNSWIAVNMPALTHSNELLLQHLNKTYGTDEKYKKNKLHALSMARNKALEGGGRLEKNHLELINVFEELLKTGDEKALAAVKHFFLDEGKYSITHVLSNNPSMFAQNIDIGKSYENINLVTSFIPPDYCIPEFIIRHIGTSFNYDEGMDILSEFVDLKIEKQWYQKQFCKNESNTLETTQENLSSLDKVLHGIRKGGQSEAIYYPAKAALDSFAFIQKLNISPSQRFSILNKHAPHILDLLLSVEGVTVERFDDPLNLKKIKLSEEELKSRNSPIVDSLNQDMQDIIGNDKLWPSSLEQLVFIYRSAESHNLFQSQESYQKMRDFIISRFQQEGLSNTDRLGAVEALLFNNPVVDPYLRETAIENWVAAIHEKLLLAGRGIEGKDDASPAYLDAIKNIIEPMKKLVPMTLGIEMIATLADKLESQRNLSYYFEDTYSFTKATLEETDGQLRALEAAIILFSKGKSRFQLVDFFASPRTDENIRQFAHSLNQYLEDGQSLFERTERSAANKGMDRDWKYDIQPDQKEEYYRIKCEQLYESYWRLPLAGRAAVMDQLLVPASKRFHEDSSMDKDENARAIKYDDIAQNRKTDASKSEKEAFNYIIYKTLPSDMKYGGEAQNFLKIYSEVIPTAQKNLLFAILLSVERASENKGEEFSIGKRLSMILDMMGPAERKLGQGINSHPSVPADLRYDSRELKFKASPLTRWQAWHEIDRTVHPDYLEELKRLGKPLGSASFYVTYEVERKDGSKGALRMLRDSALPQAKEGFRLLNKFVDSYRTQHSDAKEMCEIMTDLIEQARGMAYTETNSTVGLAQMQHAQQLYNGYHIQVDGHTFHLKNANWRGYGPEFMDQEYQPGTHFIELPEKTGEELAYKKATAKAYVAMEFINILSGESFDHDRHGAQLRINRTGNNDSDIGLFDNGAIHAEVRKKDGSLAEPYVVGREKEDDYKAALENGGTVTIPPPTKEEKVLLAKTLFKAVQDYLDPNIKRPIAETLYDEVRNIRQITGSTPGYLLRVQRALLSLNDFFGFEKANGNGNGHANDNGHTNGNGHSQARYIDDKDIADILTGIVQARDDKGQKLIDPEIEKAIFGGVGNKLKILGSKLMGGGLAEQLSRFQSDNPVFISRDKQIEYESPRPFEVPPPDFQQAIPGQSTEPMTGVNSLRQWVKNVIRPQDSASIGVGKAYE